jgi:alpha(1,3/1,4) fucosyltransferase
VDGPRLAFAVTPEYGADRLFDRDSPLNRDDCLSLFHVLQERIAALGGWCHTLDVCRAEGLRPDVVLFQEIPDAPVAALLDDFDDPPEAWLYPLECHVIQPRNWDAEAQLQFSRILTWSDPLVDGERCLKFNFTNRLFVPEPLRVADTSRGLCTLIAGNKHASHPLELYSERRRVIRWFEQHHPEHFDLYGMGWGDGPEHYPSYRGTVARKLDVLERYWFTICFENARDVPGYITEKIFDAFLARTVPIYWGADNISDHVPREAFVDFREFDGLEELYGRLVSMEAEEYEAHLEAARRFIRSGGARQFTDEGCADVVIGALQAARSLKIQRA